MSDEVTHRVSLAVLGDTRDRLRVPLRTVACWRLGDGVFRFDHKLIGPEAKEAFAEFWRIRDRHPSAPVALFGHADIKGDDEYNHQLAAERAQAVMGVLDGSVDLWVELFAGDRDGLRALQELLGGYGLDEPEEGFGPRTREAVARYFDDLCGGRRLEVWDYLDDGLRALQSCSELNPVVRPSRALLERLSHAERARLEAVNRRVVAYFFEPGTHVGDRWPCPVARAGVDGCRTRLWSDAGERRKTPREPLQYWPVTAKGRAADGFTGSERTFACRFYERLARGRACELVEPWRPPEPEPDPPPPKKEPVPPKEEPDPEPEEDPEDWELRLVCQHEGHVNRRRLMAMGADVIELVPPSDGEDVTMSTEPNVTVAWTRPDGSEITGMGTMWHAPGVPMKKDFEPWDLLRVEPVRRTVVATKDGRVQRCEIDVYPHAQYSFDFEVVRRSLRDKLWAAPVAIWEEIGALFADDFELDVLEKDDFGGHLKIQWREHPGVAGSGEIDYRAYLGYWLRFYADPLARCSATMSVSLSKLVRFLRRYPLGRKFVDKIPDAVMKRIDSISFEGSFDAEGGGSHDIRVDEPGHPLPSIGTNKPGAAKVEIKGKFAWRGKGKLSFDELVYGDGEKEVIGSIKASLSADMEVIMGLIVDIGMRRLGAYLEGDFSGVDLYLELDLPGESADYVVPLEDKMARKIDRITFEFDF